MRLGITGPVVTAVPGAHSPWEPTAGIEELRAIAEAADRLGFHHLTCSEHATVPTGVAEQRGGPTGTRSPPSATSPPAPAASGSRGPAARWHPFGRTGAT
ncbi:hypothetical protein ACFVV1_34895, partial [Streptomyces sp. NPDC058092]